MRWMTWRQIKPGDACRGVLSNREETHLASLSSPRFRLVQRALEPGATQSLAFARALPPREET